MLKLKQLFSNPQIVTPKNYLKRVNAFESIIELEVMRMPVNKVVLYGSES